MSSNPVRLADYVAGFVADQGVGCVFLVPGGGSMYLVDAFGAEPRLTYVANHHEQQVRELLPRGDPGKRRD